MLTKILNNIFKIKLIIIFFNIIIYIFNLVFLSIILSKYFIIDFIFINTKIFYLIIFIILYIFTFKNFKVILCNDISTIIYIKLCINQVKTINLTYAKK